MDKTEETRTVRDPFLGVDAVISSRLTDRLRGKYACGPTLPNGEPEFGWRENWTPPIQHEAATRIETLEADVVSLTRERDQAREALEEIDAELDRQVYLDAVYSHARAMRNNDLDLPPDYQHDVLITEALWDKIRAVLSPKKDTDNGLR